MSLARLSQVGGSVSVPGQFTDAKSAWIAQLVATIDALATYPQTRDVAVKSGSVALNLVTTFLEHQKAAAVPFYRRALSWTLRYVDRLLRIVATQINIKAPLLTATLKYASPWSQWHYLPPYSHITRK